MNLHIAVLVLVVGGIPMAAEPCSKQELERGLFGVAWSDSGDEINKKLPSSQPLHASGRLVMVRGKHDFCGVQIKFFTLRLSERAHKIESADFAVSAVGYGVLAEKLEKVFGEPRAVTVSGDGTFSHILEWSGPHVSLRMQFVTRERARISAAVTDVFMHVQPGPIIESEVSRIESALIRGGRTTE